MKLKKLTMLLFLCASVTFTACKSQEEKDMQIKQDIDKILVGGVAVEVERGVAKIQGTFENEETHKKVLKDARNVPNVKSVVDDAITQAMPTITTDKMLQQK